METDMILPEEPQIVVPEPLTFEVSELPQALNVVVSESPSMHGTDAYGSLILGVAFVVVGMLLYIKSRNDEKL